jgi:hypothetical protein
MIARVYGKWMPSADVHAGDKAVALFAEQQPGNGLATVGVKPLR